MCAPHAGRLARQAEVVYAKRFPADEAIRRARVRQRHVVTATFTSGRVAWVRTELYQYEA
jgi:hypothetical protein